MRSMVLVAAIAMCGCDAPNDGEQEQLFSITRVELADATHPEVVTVKWVTRSELQAIHSSQRAAETGIGASDNAISQDTGCAGTSLKLHDLNKIPCQMGGCNTICFAGSGTADLTSYCRTWNIFHVCTSHWDNNVVSFEPNGNYGDFWGSCNGLTQCVDYSNLQGWTDTTSSSCVRQSENAVIGSHC